MSQLIKINGHGHLLPYPEDIPAFMRDKRFFWVDNKREFMHQGDWKRPITDPSFFLNEKLEWMEKNNIQHEVVLNLSQLYCNGLTLEDTAAITTFQNDFNAKVQHSHPDKFTTGFVIQPQYLDLALKEIERCVKELGMKFMCLSTHYQHQSGEWLSVADQSCDPIWELANELNLAVQIHPYDAGKMVALKDHFWRYHLVWMMAQTADTYLMMVYNGFVNKYPNVRVSFAHGAMLAQANFGRLKQGIDGRPDLFPGATHPNESLKHPNFFFDSLVHDIDTFELMLKRAGANQIICGIDDPYPLGEMETVPGCYPGILIDEAEKKGLITDTEKQNIWKDNCERWIGSALN